MKIYILLLLVVACLWSCKEDVEMPERGFYELTTNVTVEDGSGVRFSADLLQTSGGPILERGFHVVRNFTFIPAFVRDPVLRREDSFTVPADKEFELYLDGDWDSGGNCEVYAYIKTQNTTYKSETVAFVSAGCQPPVVHSVDYVIDENGYDNMVIKGERFSTIDTRIDVEVGYHRIYVVKCSETEIITSTPFSDNQGYYDMTLSVAGQSTVFKDAYYVHGPRIVSVDPVSPIPGQEVTMTFENVKDINSLQLLMSDIGWEIGLQKLSASGNKIVFVCPETLGSRSFRVRDKDGIYSKPYIIEVQNLWEKIEGKHYHASSNSVVINETGFIATRDYMLRFDPEVYETTRIEYPFGFYKVDQILFASGNDLYIAGYEEEHLDPELFKYNTIDGTWSNTGTILTNVKDSDQCPTVSVGDHFYIMPNSSWGYESIFYKYSLSSGSSEIFNTSHYDAYSYLSYKEGIYCFIWGELMKYDANNIENGPEHVSTFPYNNYCYVRALSARRDDVLYFSSHTIIWEYNLITKRYKSLGTPNLSYRSYNLVILPFENEVIVGRDGDFYKFKKQ